MEKTQSLWDNKRYYNLQRHALNIAVHFLLSQPKNRYLYANFVMFSRKYKLYIDFRFLLYIFAAEFHFKQRQL